jgi:hypothetical protein
MKMKADLTGLRMKVGNYLENLQNARTAALTTAMDLAASEILAKTPVDTHRLKRGFVMAFNEMGLKPRPVPEITESKRKWKKQRKLVRQLLFLDFKVKTMEAVGPLDPGATKILRKYIQWRQRALEELEKFAGDSIIAINKGRGVEITVRNKVYGGRGAVVQGDGVTRLEGVNLEAHASIRERTNRNVVSSLSSLKIGTKIKTMRTTYLKTVIKRERAAERLAAKMAGGPKEKTTTVRPETPFVMPDWLANRIGKR